LQPAGICFWNGGVHSCVVIKLPEAEHDAEEWQAALAALMLVAEHNGPTMFARINVMRSKKAAAGLRKSATAPHMGMIRSPQLMWPCVVNKRLPSVQES
jgi:hypothetical protein